MKWRKEKYGKIEIHAKLECHKQWTLPKKRGKSKYRKLGGCDQNQPLIQFKFKNTHWKTK